MTINIFRNTDELVPYTAGDTIFEENQPGELMYVVVEGEVEIRHNGRVFETVEPGGIFGEMAIVDNKPRSASAVAKTDCKLGLVNQKRFTFLVQQTPYFAIQVMSIMADRLRRANDSN